MSTPLFSLECQLAECAMRGHVLLFDSEDFWSFVLVLPHPARIKLSTASKENTYFSFACPFINVLIKLYQTKGHLGRSFLNDF